MSSPEDREKHRKRIRRKVREKKFKVKSPIAKSLESSEFAQKIILDKRGRRHNLEEMKFRDLVEAIQEE